MSHSPEARHTNRLAGESSPYLLQHAHNPVDWYPWGPEALARAKAEDKPILLSIGYSSCHWCHVMERESFENERIAGLMNQWFVSVKVDREERPDLDAIYMQAVQAMNRGQGGWPMTVFLTPDGTPFYSGTYYPPEDRGGMPGFPRVLNSIAQAWQNRRNDVLGNAAQMRDLLQNAMAPAADATLPLDASALDTAAQALMRQYEPVHGSFGGAPKFPQPMALEFLLRQWHRTGRADYLEAVTHTLDAMANGGIYDQLGGGFARYSVDDHWLVPHFEKMLYDNAQLARIYLHTYQATGNSFYRQIAEQTLDYVLRDMTNPAGGFYSSEDADSEGEEGKFYVWTPAELERVLGAEDARIAAAYWDVTLHGNFEDGRSILHISATPANVARQLGLSEAAAHATIERSRERLFEARGKRVRPGRDEKVLAAWNGLMLRAFAEAARIFNSDPYRQAAIQNGEFLLSHMRAPEGRMLRTWKPGHTAHLNGYLEDQANVADGLVALYEATFDPRWLEAAVHLAELTLQHFADPESGGFFDTSDDHEDLVARPKNVYDNATPSGNAVMADVLQRLALLTDRDDFRQAAQGVFHLLNDALPRAPLAFARTLDALDFSLGRPLEIALMGDQRQPAMQRLAETVFGRYLPNRVLAGSEPGDAASTTLIPLLADRPLRGGQPTAYVCEGYVCQQPVTTPEALAEQLQRR